MRSWIKKFFSNGWKLDVLFVVMVSLLILMTVITGQQVYNLYEDPCNPVSVGTVEGVTTTGEKITYQIEVCIETGSFRTVE